MASSQLNGIAIFSGGLDSTTMVWDAIVNRGLHIDLVSFDYGQRHKKELEYAARTAERLGLRHDIVDLSSITPLLAESGSSLVSSETVPEGHYAEDNMKATIVPNRNMMMISIAVSIAVARKAPFVLTGVHAGDHAVYPDCRPEFVKAVSYAAMEANLGSEFKAVVAPYMEQSKEDIAAIAIGLHLDLSRTWSCYKGGELHCGRCGTCVERLEAIYGAQARLSSGDILKQYDTTKYEDTKFWQEAVAAQGVEEEIVNLDACDGTEKEII